MLLLCCPDANSQQVDTFLLGLDPQHNLDGVCAPNAPLWSGMKTNGAVVWRPSTVTI
ncbi:hypothetical protein DPMN_111820 [Dreissena polymorpha]|uniref:Uncharacterized protein n=1 Tax=Dreissena polymorpha TaxID=45954 RepID=A0A9D4QP66_DREPO|nr:hypothetical protein DPMN_111820 [Dreissena polymorpha]